MYIAIVQRCMSRYKADTRKGINKIETDPKESGCQREYEKRWFCHVLSPCKAIVCGILINFAEQETFRIEILDGIDVP